MVKNKSEENEAKDGSVKVHIGPEVVCDDVEKVRNEIKLNCCKCSSKKVNLAMAEQIPEEVNYYGVR